ncbi:sugar efflux transporter [Vibrio sp. SCSIO 43136]|uniref:sugar efflux transporter n=1 Tax=Vibrio sp. SCSIO 43136 TaxID=2819101 RepID=UPI00207590DA|nr:sugar efflux transporter [Vibrio sp. SCSIO 43136]USD65600.1 sugar efflux transporter [Vibrio sp. SCSIO 43136]
MYRDKIALLFIGTAFAIGLCGAFFYPLTSLFIVEALGAQPAMLSLYMFLAVSSSVVVSQWIAKRSDQGLSRKRILMVSMSCYMLTAFSFVFIRDYYLALIVVVMLGSVGGAAFGQLFAMGREYGDKYLSDSTSFMSVMRSGIAIAWVFGPPLAFWLKAQVGFSASFSVSAVVGLTSVVLTGLFLPDAVSQSEEVNSEPNKGLNTQVVLFCIAVVLMFGSNNLYITSMPLYLSQELVVDPSWLGLLFGAAALFEIPIMIAAGAFAARFGAKQVLLFGTFAGTLFYLTIIYATQFWALLAAQLLNGLFIGVCATLGMTVLQDMMKDRLGTASTLFSNMLQVSLLVASLSVGVIGELSSYYSSFYACLVGVVLSGGVVAYLAFFSVQDKPQEGAVCS